VIGTVMLGGIVFGTAALVKVSVFGTPPTVCTLPRLSVPETPGKLAWSPDGKRLLAACPNGIYETDFPSRSVRPIPMPRGTTWHIWYDYAGRPLALVDVTASPKAPRLHFEAGAAPPAVSSGHLSSGGFQLTRWNAVASAWRRVADAGQQASLSTDGRYLAARYASGIPQGGASFKPMTPNGPNALIRITDLERGKQLSEIPFRGRGVPFLLWEDPRVICLRYFGAPSPTSGGGPSDRWYTVGDPSIRAARPVSTRPQTATTAIAGKRLSGSESALRLLRSWHVRGVPPEDPVDLSMSIHRGNAIIGPELSLGRVYDHPLFGQERPQPMVSPTGEYLAAVAGDGSLRYTELKEHQDPRK